MVTITYAPLGPQYGAMQSLHYVRDDAIWLNMIILFRQVALSARLHRCVIPLVFAVVRAHCLRGKRWRCCY